MAFWIKVEKIHRAQFMQKGKSQIEYRQVHLYLNGRVYNKGSHNSNVGR